MPTLTLPNNWRPRWYQRPLWDYLEKGGKRAFAVEHRRWGKDDVLLHRTAVAAMERPATYWHCLPQYEQARKAIWGAVNAHTGQRRIDEAFPEEIRDGKDEQQMFIRLKNGSTWQVIGSDRYNSLVGSGVAGVAFSEWALANPSAWGYIRPMLAENNGWAAFITTPRGRNHAHSMLRHAEKSPDWFAEVSTIYDTGALTPEQIEEARAEYIAIYGEDFGRAQFEQEYECSFNAAILGAFYALECAAVRREGRLGDFDPLPGYPVHRAWDIGVKDDTSIWWFQVLPGGRVLWLDVYSASGVGVQHYAEVVEARGWPRGGAIDYVPHDARVKEWGTDKTRVESMLAHGLNPEVVPNIGKLDGIEAARKTIQKSLFHSRTEDDGFGALEQYRRDWDDDGKTFKASEVRDWTTHPSDAFRYGAVAWQAMKPPSPIEKRQTPEQMARIPYSALKRPARRGFQRRSL